MTGYLEVLGTFGGKNWSNSSWIREADFPTIFALLGHYVIDPWKVRDYVVPDLNQFEVGVLAGIIALCCSTLTSVPSKNPQLTPYVTPKLDDQEIRVRPFTYKTFMDRHPEGRETMEKVRDAQLVVAIEMVQKLAMEREQLGARRKLGVSKPPLL